MLERQKPRTPMRSCKVEVKHQSTPMMCYIGTVNESRMINDKLESVEVDRIETNIPTELQIFLVKYGVQPSEIAVAGQVMAQMDHNCAAFGWFGGFLYTFTSEVVH